MESKWSERPKAALVFLYGCNIDSPLKRHLDNVIRVSNERNIRYFFLCGGPTQQKSFPDLTEARVAWNYLRSRVPNYCIFYLEEYSFTSHYNAKNGSAKVHGVGIDFSEVFVFVEATKALRARILLRHFLPEFHPGKMDKRIRFETATWEQANPIKELVSTVLETLALYLPLMARYAQWSRMRKAKYR